MKKNIVKIVGISLFAISLQGCTFTPIKYLDNLLPTIGKFSDDAVEIVTKFIKNNDLVGGWLNSKNQNDDIVKIVKQIAKQSNKADELPEIEKLGTNAMKEVDKILKDKASSNKIILQFKESCEKEIAEEIVGEALEAIKEKKVKESFSGDTAIKITQRALRNCITKKSNSNSIEIETANKLLEKIEDGLEKKREFQQKQNSK